MVDDVLIELATEQNADVAIQFLVDAVTADEAEARQQLADHARGEGSSLLAFRAALPVGIVTVRSTSDYAGFRDRGIPLLHQLAVSEDARGQRVASALLDAMEELAVRERVSTMGTTVGLADSYGPAQRLYAKRGYVPDGRGACVGQRPAPLGASVTVDHDLVLWLTKDVTDRPA